MSIDFDRYMEERASNYAPRPWLFERIAAWIAQPGASRYLLLTGQPGGGKTAVAAQLCNISRGRVQATGPVIPRSSISAYHFCFSKDAAWLDPVLFGQSIASQLATSIPSFTQGRDATRPELGHVTAHGSVTTNHISGGNVKAVEVNIHAGSPETAFMHAVRRPLEEVYRQGHDRDTIVLVDGLDEAKLLESGPTILDLISRFHESLPRVRFLVTSRNEVDVIRRLEDQDKHLIRLDLDVGDARRHSRNDVYRYVTTQLDESPDLVELASSMTPEVLRDQLTRKADGNFLWAKMALATVAESGQMIDQALLDALPSELKPMYLEFLGRVSRRDVLRWRGAHARVLGVLAIAREAMTPEQLATYAQLPASTVMVALTDLRQLLSIQSQSQPSPRYSLYHRSLADFLSDANAAQEHYVDEMAQHECIIESALRMMTGTGGQRVWTQSDEYSRNHLAAHLFAMRTSAAMRAHLFSLATKEWLQLKASEASFASDMALVAEVAVGDEEEIHRVRARLILTTLRSLAHALPTEALILLVRLGEVQRAKSYFALLSDANSKLRTACEIAKHLPPADAAIGEEFLQAAPLSGSDPYDRERANTLRALSLVTQGRFDEFLLLPASIRNSKIVTSLADAAARAGRWDVLEAVYGEPEFAAELARIAVVCALDRNELPVAMRWSTRLGSGGWEAGMRLVRALRTFDVAAAIDFARTSSVWRESDALEALLEDAVLESKDAMERVLAVFPQVRSLEHVLIATAESLARKGRFDLAAPLVAEDRLVWQRVRTAYIVHLVDSGHIEQADELVAQSDSEDSHVAYLEALGRSAQVDAERLSRRFIDLRHSIHRPKSLLDAIWHARGPDFTLSVVRSIVTEPRVEAYIVQRLITDAVSLFALNGQSQSVADLAPQVKFGLSAQVLNCLCEVLLNRGEIDSALGVAQSVEDKLDVDLSARILAALVAAKRKDAAIAFVQHPFSKDRTRAVVERAVMYAAETIDGPQLFVVVESTTSDVRTVVLRALVRLAHRAQYSAAMKLDKAFAAFDRGAPFLAIHGALELCAAGYEAEARHLFVLTSVTEYRPSRYSYQLHRPEQFVMRELLRMRCFSLATEWIERGAPGMGNRLLIAMLAERRASVGDIQMIEWQLEDAVNHRYRDHTDLLARCAMAMLASGNEGRARAIFEQVRWGCDEPRASVQLAQACIDPSRAEIVQVDDVALLIEIAERNIAEVSVAALYRAVRLSKDSTSINHGQEIVLAALQLLPIAQTSALLLTPLSSKLDVPGLLYVSVLRQCFQPMLALVRELYPGTVWPEGTFAHTLRALGEWELWPEALQIAKLANQKLDVEALLLTAARLDQLGKVAAMASDLGLTHTQKIIREQASDAHVSIRIQASEFLALDTSELRAAWAIQLCDSGAVASAFKAACSIQEQRARQRSMTAVLVMAVCRSPSFEWAKALWGDERERSTTETQQIAEDAANELLKLNRPAEFVALVYRLPDDSALKRAAPATLARSGLPMSAFDLARLYRERLRDTALTELALVLTKQDPEGALQTVRIASASHQPEMLTELLRALAIDGHDELVWRSIDESTCLDGRALSSLGLAFIEANRPKDARKLLTRALSILEGTGDDWPRSDLLSQLARAAAERRQPTVAQSLVDRISRKHFWHATAIESVASAFQDDATVLSGLISSRLPAIRLIEGATDIEARLTMRLLASGNISHLDDAIQQISQPKRSREGAAMALVELSREIVWMNPPRRWRWVPGARALNARLRRKQAHQLLEAALVEIRGVSDTHLAARMKSLVLLRYAELQDLDLEVARKLAKEAFGSQLPLQSPSDFIALSNISLVIILSNGLTETAARVALQAIEDVRRTRGEMYKVSHLLGRVLAALGPDHELVSRLISYAADDGRNSTFLRVISAAAAEAPATASRFGAQLAAAAETADVNFLPSLFSSIVTCALIDAKSTLIETADSLVALLTSGARADLIWSAVELARVDPVRASRWLTSAIALEPSERPWEVHELFGAARGFHQIGNAGMATKYFELAFRHSLDNFDGQFHTVLSQLVQTRPAHDPLVMALPELLNDVESWWSYRR